MRLLFAMTPVAGFVGGAERALCKVASGLAARGHQVAIATPDPPGSRPFFPLADGVDLVSLAPSGWPRAARQIARLMRLARLTRTGTPLAGLAWHLDLNRLGLSLAALLARVRPDVAIGFGPVPIIWLGTGCGRAETVRIGSIRLPPETEFGIRRADPVPFQTRRAFAALRQLDRITVLLPEFVSWFPEDLRGRVRVTPNIVEPAAGPVPEASARDRLIVSVVRLAQQKRPDRLVAAWARIRDSFPDWRVEIYGEGYLRRDLEQQISALGPAPRIALMGATSDIAGVLRRAALMVHPAAEEGFPNAVGEALAHGVPVLGFADCPGVNTLVLPGVNGVLVEPGEDDARALAAGIAALLADDGLRWRLAAAGPRSMAPYGEAAVIDIWEDLIGEARRSARAA